MATLTLIRRYPDGGASYGIEGVRGAVGIKKSMLTGDAPDTLEVNFDGFKAPGSGGGGARKSNPEYIAKLQERVAKSEEREAKRAARLAKDKVRLAKLVPAQTAQSAQVEQFQTADVSD